MEQQNFTPEEIKAVNLIIKQACQVLLDPQAMEALAQDAKDSDPGVAIADAVVPVVKSVYAAAQQAGKELDMRVVALAGREIVKVLTAILGAAGIVKPQDAQRVALAAFKQGVASHNASAGAQA